MPVASLAGINQHYKPIPFTAPCPRCQTDAAWVSFMAQDKQGQPWTPHSHITCPKCGPCPCEWHDDVEGVAA